MGTDYEVRIILKAVIQFTNARVLQKSDVFSIHQEWWWWFSVSAKVQYNNLIIYCSGSEEVLNG
jgi:hypothetical protein